MPEENPFAFNRQFFEALGALISEPGRVANDEVDNYIRHKMHRVTHIPATYLVPSENLTPEGRFLFDYELSTLTIEMRRYGSIALDRDGLPACLSGKPAVIPHTDGEAAW